MIRVNSMLVLMGPSFAGGDADYQRLSKVTGMVAYDLRARLKPGIWGLVKALADEVEAGRLAASLKADGFPVVVVAREVAADPERQIVALRSMRVEGQELTLDLRERTMQVPAAALCCIVRGEAQVGRGSSRSGGAGATSSATFRAVVPDTSDLQVFRESMPPASFEAFAAADLHFHSVPWIARIDARSFDFRALGIAAASPAGALDTLVDRLALLGRVRVDRAARSSSISSFTQQAARGAPLHPHPGAQGAPMSQRAREVSGDERLDPYSRVVGEAERLLAADRASSVPKA
jgi:hypothetical protein